MAERVIYNAHAVDATTGERVDSMVWGTDEESAAASMQEWLDNNYPGQPWEITVDGLYQPL